MSKTTFAERLVESMKAAGFTQASLAAAVGMSQSSIWKLTSGAASGSRKTVELAKALHVRPEWLASGELPMNDNESNAMIKKNKAIILSMTPEEREDASLLRASRKNRIAKGSGTTINDVNRLINQYEKAKDQMRLLKRLAKNNPNIK